ncbi:MAG: universal stress protein [Gammaproteobacteria bacterium]|nr:universal stress protein [Gammaproteobacteria bacterium]
MLPKFEKILYASDLGDRTRPASRAAVSLAQQYGATIVMCHALEPVGAYGRALIENYISHEDLEAAYRDGQKRVLETMRERLKRFCEEELAGTADMSAHVSSLVVKEGPPGEVIVDEAAKHEVDLIVVGTHRGTSGLKRMLIGSTARYVTQHAACPVFVVPTE